jgi:hypothetical protein
MRPVAYGPHRPRLPPCRAGGLASALMLGFGLRLWQSTWSFPSVFRIQVYCFPSLVSTDNSSSLLLHYLLPCQHSAVEHAVVKERPGQFIACEGQTQKIRGGSS